MTAPAANSTQIAMIAAGERHSFPRISRNRLEHPISPMIASTVTSDVRPPKAISDPRLNAISGSRTGSGGQSADEAPAPGHRRR